MSPRKHHLKSSWMFFGFFTFWFLWEEYLREERISQQVKAFYLRFACTILTGKSARLWSLVLKTEAPNDTPVELQSKSEVISFRWLRLFSFVGSPKNKLQWKMNTSEMTSSCVFISSVLNMSDLFNPSNQSKLQSRRSSILACIYV